MSCLVGALTLGCLRPTVRPPKQKASPPLADASPGGGSCASSAARRPRRPPPGAPQSVFHGLHWSFEALRRELPRLAAEGYDAVQLPPAQRSRKGDLRKEWFLRYQPLRYGEVDPQLGGEAALHLLCRDAAELGVMVIADCVFNHMAVVACRAEWEAAQEDERLMEELKRRLDSTFGPELNRFDFQWPWVCLEGAKWDDPQFKYEGWGCGEWSELKWSPRVLEAHYNHLRTLLRCGVRGFRIDAAKHMRPQHVNCYVDFLQQNGAFVYVEVLSLQRDEHVQYEVLGNGSSHVLSTDYLSASLLCGAVRTADPAALLPRLLPLAWPTTEAVRFVRSHDTVLNDEAICGIDWHSAEEAQAAWAYLLSLPGGCALIYSEDRALPAVRRAVAFRRLLAERARGEREKKDAKTKADQGSSVRTQVTAWPPPHYSLLLAMPTGPNGKPLGLVAVNFSQHSAATLQLPLHLQGLALTEVLGGQRCNGEWQPRLSEPFTVPGLLPVVIPPNDARFFVIAEVPSTPRSAVQIFTLLYFSGWDRPHLHFGIRGHWTRAPGWPLLASPPPPPGLGSQVLGGGSGGKRPGRWWRADVPLPGPACATEFVLNDGSADVEATLWDKNPQQQNYVIPGSGTYILDSGRLMRLGGSA